MSRADAVAAAAQWLDTALGTEPVPPLLIAVGGGDGHLLPALEQRAPDTRLLVLEPDPVAARTFATQPAWKAWHESGRLLCLAGPDYAGADRAWRLFPASPDAHKLLLHPSLARDPRKAVGALQAVKRIVFGVRANAEARRKFAPRYLANVIRNAPAMANGHDVRALTDAFRGVPAIVAAAGPSLDGAIEDLRATRDRALLIAVDTALRPLLHAGIAPQLVVGADPGAANARHFQALPSSPDTWLVSESALDRSATSHFDGRTFWFRLARHHPWPWLNEMGLEVGHVEMWGSVLTAAFQVACLAGCDPIVIVGADLAYTGGRPYCRGTTYEFDWARATARGRTLEEVWAEQTTRRPTRQVPDVHGHQTTTTDSMLSFRDWMLAAATRSGRRVVNATGAGTLFGDGVEQGSIRDVLSEGVAIPSLDAIVPAPVPSCAPQDLAARLAEVRSVLNTAGAGAPPVADWAAFLGEGYDPAALDAALGQAVDALSGTQPVPAAPATIDWSQAHTRELLMRLPESLGRFREALTATGSRPETSNVVDQSVLVDTFDLLQRICLEARRLDALPLAVKPWQVGRLPVSALYAWPDALRWAVELFEAILERAGRPAGAPAQSDFLTRRVHVRDAAAAPPDRCTAPTERDHMTQACALLVIDWLRAASSLHAAIDPRIQAPVAQAIASMSCLRSEASGTPQACATLVLRLRAASAGALDLAVPVAVAAFARRLTGTFGDPDGTVHERMFAADEPFQVSIDLRFAPVGSGSRAPAVIGSTPPRIVPRVLTDEGVPRALVVYRQGDGMVCILFHRCESVLVCRDGSVRPHHQWPRPIVNELPFGDGGAVAWGDGLSGFPDRVDPGYVMYKDRPDGEIVVQDLPVRPTVGRWWQGRLYWNCHPRRVESPTGLVSWAPGDEAPRSELPDLPATIGIHSREDGLVFEPGGGPLQGGRWQRRFEQRGWTWRPGEELQPIPLGPYGAASARDVSGAWAAIAHPEADLVRLEHVDGQSVPMACYYPFGLGWLGDSLLVGTIEQELLLFENLAGRLQ